MQVSPVDLAARLIVARTDLAARVAVVRTQRDMQAELLRATGTKPPPPPHTGNRIDRSA